MLKNILVLIAFLSLCTNVYGLGKGLFELGYSNLTFKGDDKIQADSSMGGFNIKGEFLFPVYPINEMFLVYVTPLIKYETVAGKGSSSSNSVTLDYLYVFKTLQLGAAAGLTLKPSKTWDLNLAGLYSYGVYNKFYTDYSNGGSLIPDQTLNYTVSNSYQYGGEISGLYNAETGFSFGLEIAYLMGSMKSSAEKIRTASIDITKAETTHNYSNLIIGLLFGYEF